MKPILIVFMTMIAGLNLFATVQIPDKIWYSGKKYILFKNPLEPYFEEYPEKRPEPEYTSSALWRGYVAFFEIRDNQLFLYDIKKGEFNRSTNRTKWLSVFNEVFPDQVCVKSEWFTGLLVLPSGNPVKDADRGFFFLYEHYVVLEINEGNLIKEKNFYCKEYEEFEERQYQAVIGTEEYRKMRDLLQERGKSNDYIDSYLKDHVLEYSSKILVE